MAFRSASSCQGFLGFGANASVAGRTRGQGGSGRRGGVSVLRQRREGLARGRGAPGGAGAGGGAGGGAGRAGAGRALGGGRGGGGSSKRVR